MMNESNDVVILLPALKMAGNIVTGTNQQTEAMLELGLLNVLPKLLRHPKANIVKVISADLGWKFCLGQVRWFHFVFCVDFRLRFGFLWKEEFVSKRLYSQNWLLDRSKLDVILQKKSPCVIIKTMVFRDFTDY